MKKSWNAVFTVIFNSSLLLFENLLQIFWFLCTSLTNFLDSIQTPTFRVLENARQSWLTGDQTERA